ncbi:DUF2125 domain-containing protein [Rubrimonas cliftonensis]|uniref:DUF2125 domain-containing protein n=1 Tax=Rubrimonas cliftonensis TaxID=89524 RepID=A0A1H4F712_9RHOB|nr:DUF2125 domain-containing protein [Rubrimonas cliftonensis]SEA92991.1 hypothetical protein SAMN05444370_1198 [Rubrimonas cliftonensis]
MRILIIGAAAAAALAVGAWGLWRVGAGEVEAAVDAQVAELAERGVLLRWENRRVEGFPLAYAVTLEGVALAASDGAWAFSAPWTLSRAPLFGGDAVVTTAAPAGRLEVSGPQGLSQLRVENEGLKIETPLGEGPATLSAEMLRLVQPGEGGAAPSTIALRGVSARAAADGGSAEGSAALVETTIEGGPAEGGGVSRLTGLTVRASTEGGEGALLSEGARREIVVAAAGSESAGPGATVGASGPVSLTIASGDGRTRYAARAAELRAGESEAADAAGTETELMTLSLDVPAAATDARQPFTLELALEGVAPNEALWRAMDPGGAMERAPGSAQVALSGHVSGAAATGGLRPVDVGALRIETFRASGLGAQLSMTGEIAMPAGASSPNGQISVAATGWAQALDALEAGGVAPPAQAALVRALAERLNAPDAPAGAFFSEIELRGGMVFANGLRVR